MPLPSDSTLAEKCGLYKLVPSDEQFFYSAAYAICVLKLSSRIKQIQKELVDLWYKMSELEFGTFKELFKSQPQVIKFIFGVSSKTGVMCNNCVTLIFPAFEYHNCTLRIPYYEHDPTTDKYTCTICSKEVASLQDMDAHSNTHGIRCKLAAGLY